MPGIAASIASATDPGGKFPPRPRRRRARPPPPARSGTERRAPTTQPGREPGTTPRSVENLPRRASRSPPRCPRRAPRRQPQAPRRHTLRRGARDAATQTPALRSPRPPPGDPRAPARSSGRTRSTSCTCGLSRTVTNRCERRPPFGPAYASDRTPNSPERTRPLPPSRHLRGRDRRSRERARAAPVDQKAGCQPEHCVE